MKKLVALCLAIVLTFAAGESIHLLAKRTARVKNAEITLEPACGYTKADLKTAANIVKRRFLWGRSTLLKLAFDQNLTETAGPEWAAHYGADEAVVLTSDFVTDDSEALFGQGFEPGHTYRGWQWILVRSHGGRWRLKTWGYA